jgi:hypothetical protein
LKLPRKEGEKMDKCNICGKDIDPKEAHYIIYFNKEAEEDGQKKTLQSEEGARICEECGGEGMSSVLWNLKLIRDMDTELNQKIQSVLKAVDMVKLMKDYGIALEKFGVNNEYLAKCPFHDQDSSFLIDAERKEYFCFCEGLKGDAISFVINYDRDIHHKHTTLKQAIDFLMEKFPAE